MCGHPCMNYRCTPHHSSYFLPTNSRDECIFLWKNALFLSEQTSPDKVRTVHRPHLLVQSKKMWTKQWVMHAFSQETSRRQHLPLHCGQAFMAIQCTLNVNFVPLTVFGAHLRSATFACVSRGIRRTLSGKKTNWAKTVPVELNIPETNTCLKWGQIGVSEDRNKHFE